MKKPKLADCPFCGKTPSGKRFCSTERGPALTCDHCGSDGPSALDRTFVGTDDKNLHSKAIEAWNRRSFDRASYRMGIEAAASLVEMFNRRVHHPYLLSDCILGKFNLLAKGKIKKNPFYAKGAEPKTMLEIGVIRAALIWHAVKVFKRYPNAGEDKSLRRAAIALLKGQPNDKFDYPKKEKRTPARRKGHRRTAGGPDFVLGSVLPKERRDRERREGVVRRRS